jgi:hypothetical protein
MAIVLAAVRDHGSFSPLSLPVEGATMNRTAQRFGPAMCLRRAWDGRTEILACDGRWVVAGVVGEYYRVLDTARRLLGVTDGLDTRAEQIAARVQARRREALGVES